MAAKQKGEKVGKRAGKGERSKVAARKEPWGAKCLFCCVF
jgi:hypothetical protein